MTIIDPEGQGTLHMGKVQPMILPHMVLLTVYTVLDFLKGKKNYIPQQLCFCKVHPELQITSTKYCSSALSKSCVFLLQSIDGGQRENGAKMFEGKKISDNSGMLWTVSVSPYPVMLRGLFSTSFNFFFISTVLDGLCTYFRFPVHSQVQCPISKHF